MNIRPAIVIIENNQLLTMHYRYGETDVYNLPGGNLEFGEQLKATLEREMQEELQMKVAVGELIGVGEVIIEERNIHTLHCLFSGKIIDGEPRINPLETKALAIRWLPIEELPNINLYPNVSTQLLAWTQQIQQDTYWGRLAQKWY